MAAQPNHDSRPRFAHPSEAEFAQILDYYGIQWEYEPHNFVIVRDQDGNPKEIFSPDFYLADFDLHIELTTARQKLIGYKRRKVRLLKEQYPEVNIKLITRDDFQKLLDKYGLDDHEQSLVGKDALGEE
jgi:hypoxanthine phosphoribosyltransferase